MENLEGLSLRDLHRLHAIETELLKMSLLNGSDWSEVQFHRHSIIEIERAIHSKQREQHLPANNDTTSSFTS
jgi:hypothetical protein